MYIHHVIECIEMFNHDKCSLSFKEKKQQIRNILDTEQVRECIGVMDRANSTYTNLVFRGMKKNSVNIVYNFSTLYTGTIILIFIINLYYLLF